MARATGRKAIQRADAQRKAKLGALCQIPEIRDAIADFEGRALELHERWGHRTFQNVGLEFTNAACLLRTRGIEIWARVGEAGRPEVLIDLRAEAANDGRAARVRHPQDLPSSSEYDVIEIRRDASLAAVLADVEVEKRWLDGVRQERGWLRRERRRGPSPKRRLRALEAYRLRLAGMSWADVARRLECHPRWARTLVTDLCRSLDLPGPDPCKPPSAVPIGADCDACTKRSAPSLPCAECPWRGWKAERERALGHRLVSDAEADAAQLRRGAIRRRPRPPHE